MWCCRARFFRSSLLVLVVATVGCRDDHRDRRPGWRGDTVQAATAGVSTVQAYLKKQHKAVERARWTRNVTQRPVPWATLWTAAGRPPSFAAVRRLRNLENSPGLDDATRRRLRYLRLALVEAHVQQKTAKERDEVGRALFALSWVDEKVGQRKGLFGLFDDLAGADAPEQRAELIRAQRGWLSRTAALVRRLDTARKVAAHRLGVDLQRLFDARNELDTTTQLDHIKRILADQAQLFAVVWRATVQPAAARGRDITLADLGHVQNGGLLRHKLPADLQLAALNRLASGLGLPLGPGDNGLVRMEPGVVTDVSSPAVPNDVRLSHGLQPGLLSSVALFEAAGRAACRRANLSSQWTFTALGPAHGEWTFGYLLGQLWLDPVWWNELSRAGVLDLSDEQVQDFLRYRVLMALLRLRIDGLAVPVIEVVRRGGHRGLFANVWDREREITATVDHSQPLLSPRLTLSGLFAGLMGRYVDASLGRSVSPLWIHYVRPMRQPFHLDPWVLALMLGQELRQNHGARWFADPAATRFLNALLCSGGRIRTAAAVARSAGLRRLRYDRVSHELERRWEAIDQLSHSPAGSPSQP